MLEITLEAVPRFDSLGRRLSALTKRKTSQLTEALYLKVVENLSGKLLETKTGRLLDSVKKADIYLGDHYYEGRIFIDPETPKARVLEKGGKGFYPITPSKADFLQFYWEKIGKIVRASKVNHPPSKAFGYLSHAVDDFREQIPEGFREVIEAAIYTDEE